MARLSESELRVYLIGRMFGLQYTILVALIILLITPLWVSDKSIVFFFQFDSYKLTKGAFFL